MDEARYQSLLGLLWQLVRKINYLQTKPQDYGIGEALPASQIHLIEAIGKNPQANITQLAKKLVITKGAVSQTVKKLEHKGLVKKQRPSGNDKEIMLKLTKKGRVAFDGHEEYHARFDQGLAAEFNAFSQQEFDMLQGLLKDLNQRADQYIQHADDQG